MIELEILVEVLDLYEKAASVLDKYQYLGDNLIVDEYYYDPLRMNLKPDASGKIFECLRVRSCESKNKLTYKQDVYRNGVWQYSNENELAIDDVCGIKEILHCLGLKELLTIRNHRRYYKYANYEIVLEKVEELGVFLEVEYKGKLCEEDVDSTRKYIELFIRGLGIVTSAEINAGKPELFIKKHHIYV